VVSATTFGTPSPVGRASWSEGATACGSYRPHSYQLLHWIRRSRTWHRASSWQTVPRPRLFRDRSLRHREPGCKGSGGVPSRGSSLERSAKLPGKSVSRHGGHPLWRVPLPSFQYGRKTARKSRSPPPLAFFPQPDPCNPTSIRFLRERRRARLAWTLHSPQRSGRRWLPDGVGNIFSGRSWRSPPAQAGLHPGV
jgi:hypothetical protein